MNNSDPGPLELLRAIVASSSQKAVANKYGISPQSFVAATAGKRLTYEGLIQ